MGDRPGLSTILRVLNETRTRATYGAVAEAVDCPSRRLGRLLGRRRPEASFVVNARTGLPTGYAPTDLHRELQRHDHVIQDGDELLRHVAAHLRASEPGEAASPAPTDFDPPRLANWQQFEQLVARLYRKMGYTVVERGGARADGGVDLEIRRDGQRRIVQCKHWSREKVGVSIVRELLGVMHHEGADGAVVACSGRFTPEAVRFARRNPVELVDGRALQRMLRQTNTRSTEGLRIGSPVRGAGRPWRTLARAAVLLALLAVVVIGPGDISAWFVSSFSLGRSGNVPAGVAGAQAVPGTPARAVPAVDPAFERAYRPPASCIASATNPRPDLVACGNHRLRAYRAFLEASSRVEGAPR